MGKEEFEQNIELKCRKCGAKIAHENVDMGFYPECSWFTIKCPVCKLETTVLDS